MNKQIMLILKPTKQKSLNYAHKRTSKHMFALVYVKYDSFREDLR